MDMIERVAKAIGEVSTAGKGASDHDLLVACAKAAIEAMREPDNWMVDCGYDHVGDSDATRATWRAMIDGALRSVPKSD